MEFNKYQTPLTDDLLMSMNEEVREQLLEYLNVPFIASLVSRDRQYACDRPRDEQGRIVVDICNPHILTDMEYFTPVADCYRKNGVISTLRVNSNKSSQYGKWFSEEIRRCMYGLVRPSDGEWIPGDMYFYLNYAPIIQSIIDPSTGVPDRIVDFPKVWELVYLRSHYHHQARFGGLYNEGRKGQHAFEIAKRGASKSYYGAAILARIFLIGENVNACKKTRSVIYASDKEKLIKDGTLNKFVDIIDFCAENTQFATKRLVDSLDKMTWTLGYKDLDTMSNRGTGNTVMGVVIGDRVGKARGKRANRQIYEEIGEFPNLVEAYNTNKRSVEEGGHSFGMSLGFGTGGSKDANFSGCMEMIFNPMGYNIYALPNVFDRNGQNSKKCILFMGAYLNRFRCYNKDGVSDVTKALMEILENRRIVKYNSSKAGTLDQVIAEDPITLQEAILKKTSSGYPVAALTEQLYTIDSSPGFLDGVYVGDLVQDSSGEIRPVTGPEYTPIRDFPHKDNNHPGAIEFYEMPVRDQNGKVMSYRYIAGLDPYDDDSSDTLSLGSLIVLDTFTDKVVCEYTGRPDYADQFYERCRLILLYYNAMVNYENNKKGLFSYFSRMNCVYLITPVLEYLREKDPQKEYYGNKAYGTQSTEPVKKYGRQRIRAWLGTEEKTTIYEGDEEREIVTHKLNTLKNRALIQELINWDPNGNYDRHDAFLMLMLLREERWRSAHGDVEKARTSSGSEKSNDKFFEDSYRKARQRASKRHG